MLKKQSLFENNNLLSLDLRFNPGATPKVLKNLALQLLKNLQLLQASGQKVEAKFLRGRVLFVPGIPNSIYHNLGIRTNKTKTEVEVRPRPAQIPQKSIKIQNVSQNS